MLGNILFTVSIVLGFAFCLISPIFLGMGYLFSEAYNNYIIRKKWWNFVIGLVLEFHVLFLIIFFSLIDIIEINEASQTLNYITCAIISLQVYLVGETYIYRLIKKRKKDKEDRESKKEEAQRYRKLSLEREVKQKERDIDFFLKK